MAPARRACLGVPSRNALIAYSDGDPTRAAANIKRATRAAGAVQALNRPGSKIMTARDYVRPPQRLAYPLWRGQTILAARDLTLAGREAHDRLDPGRVRRLHREVPAGW